MGKLRIHLIGQVAHPARHRGVLIDLIGQERAKQGIRGHRQGIGIVGIHLRHVPRVYATLPGGGDVIGQPQVAHPFRYVGRCIALARHHCAAGGFLVEVIVLRVDPGEVAFRQQLGGDAQ